MNVTELEKILKFCGKVFKMLHETYRKKYAQVHEGKICFKRKGCSH